MNVLNSSAILRIDEWQIIIFELYTVLFLLCLLFSRTQLMSCRKVSLTTGSCVVRYHVIKRLISCNTCRPPPHVICLHLRPWAALNDFITTATVFPNTHTHAGGGKYGNTGPNCALSHTESKPGICHHKLAKCCLRCQIIHGKSHGYLEDVNHVPAGLFAGYSLSLLNIMSCLHKNHLIL